MLATEKFLVETTSIVTKLSQCLFSYLIWKQPFVQAMQFLSAIMHYNTKLFWRVVAQITTNKTNVIIAH